VTKEFAIRARGLRKAYRIYSRPIDSLLEALTRRPRHTERVALDHVDLDLRKGEIVGILGRNGAGKSTLLKIIAGTLERTSGELEVDGRITAILELGTGFHPDYTGRENIYMGGLCLGMTRAEIDARLDSIIGFSELADVIDQPFRTYSTGMQARLTFSTAISVDPEILIVDEALSVGDARFQSKCFARMQKLRENATTVLLVSHDTNTITSLCDRAMILEKGTVYAEGDAKKVSVIYHNMLFERRQSAFVDGSPAPASTSESADAHAVQAEPARAGLVRYGSGEARLLGWSMSGADGNPAGVLESGSRFTLAMTLRCLQALDDLSFGFAIKDRRGTVLWGVTNLAHGEAACEADAGAILEICVSGTMWLAAGDYFVTLGAAHLADGSKIDFVEDAIAFRVTGPGRIFTNSFVNLQSDFRISELAADRADET
jgi:lipopolysaccharide transport system ATP-binding protein